MLSFWEYNNLILSSPLKVGQHNFDCIKEKTNVKILNIIVVICLFKNYFSKLIVLYQLLDIILNHSVCEEWIHLHFSWAKIWDIDCISLISTGSIPNVVISLVFVTLPNGRALVRSFTCPPVTAPKEDGQRLNHILMGLIKRRHER